MHAAPVHSPALLTRPRVLAQALAPPTKVDPEPFRTGLASCALFSIHPPTDERGRADIPVYSGVGHTLFGAADVADAIAKEISSERLTGGLTCLSGAAQNMFDFAVIVRAGAVEGG